MLKDNFRTASCSVADIDAKLASLQQGFEEILNKGGISALKADPVFQWKAATLMREVVTDQYAMWNPTPGFVERRTSRLGDKVEVTRIIGRNRVVKYSPGSHPLIFVPRKAKYSISTSQKEIAWGLELIKVMERQMTVADSLRYASQAMIRDDVEMVLTAIKASVTANTDLRGKVLHDDLAGAITQTPLDAALARLSSYGVGDVTIYGTKAGLSAIYGFAGTSGGDATKEELVRRGVVGTYKGARLVEFQFYNTYDIYDDSFQLFAGTDLDNIVLIAAGAPGCTFMERDISALNWEELDTEKGHFRTGIRMDKGVFVHSPWLYHLFLLNGAT